MRKLFMTCLLLAANVHGVHAKLNIVATLPVFASIAQDIAGDNADITSIARANQDPHFLDAKPSYVVLLSKADMLIHGGIDLEIGWLPALLMQARNAKIQSGGPGNVDTSRGLSIMEIAAKADRSQGDVHPNGNPHHWLDPENAKLIAANIYSHSALLDPANEAVYKKHLTDFINRLNVTATALKGDLKKLAGAKIVTYHKSFTYFARWSGIDVVATVEPKPGIPPSSRHVDELLQLIPRAGVKVILVEDYYPHKVPDYLAEKTGVRVLVAPNTTGAPGINTYDALLRHLVRTMAGAL